MDPERIKVIIEWPTPPSIRKIWGFHELKKFYKICVPYFSILVAPLIELDVPSWEDSQEMCFQTLPYFNIQNPEFEKPQDLRSNPFQGGGNDAILPRKGIG